MTEEQLRQIQHQVMQIVSVARSRVARGAKGPDRCDLERYRASDGREAKRTAWVVGSVFGRFPGLPAGLSADYLMGLFQQWTFSGRRASPRAPEMCS